MVITDWKIKAEQLKFDDGKSWREVANEIKSSYFPTLPYEKVIEKVRAHIRSTDRYRTNKPFDDIEHQVSVQYNAKDGTTQYDRLISICETEEMTPETMLKAHGLDNKAWEIVSYRNNYWHSQVKGGTRLLMYQSKITVKPKAEDISFESYDHYFETKQFKYDKPLTAPINYSADGEILEICLPDLHSGLLAWRKETGADYDIAIAKDHFFKCLYDIRNRCVGKRFKKILFVTLGDLLHTDNDDQTTTKGTFQQVDGRMSKIFDSTLDMLIDGITIIGNIAPVEVIYLSGNHDRVLGYSLLKAASMAFRKDTNITFDTEPNPQKYRLMGNILIGFTHGDMPKKSMPDWLQQRARKEYGQSKFAEVHAGHLHSQQTTEFHQTEEGKGIIVRYLPTICNASYWEHQQGFSNSVKTLVSFVWNEETGLRDMWFSNL